MLLKIPVDPNVSYIKGRNGAPDIKEIQLLFDPNEPSVTSVWIDGISAKRGVVVNGGFRIDKMGFKAVCEAYLATYEAEPAEVDQDQLEKLLDHLEESTDTADALAYVRASYAEEMKFPGAFDEAWKAHADCLADLEG